MKKLTALLMMFAMVASMSIFAQEVAAPEAAPEVEPESEKCALIPSVALSLDVKSKYMCDGEVVNPDGMLFLDAFAAWDCGLYIDLWTAIDLNGYNNGSDHDADSYFKNDRRNRPEEIDYVIGYAYTFEDLLAFSPLTFDVAYKYFQYPRCKGDSDEQIDSTVKLNNLLDKEGDAWLSTSFTWRYRTRGNSPYTNYSWVDVTYGYNFTEKFSAFLSNKVFYMCKSKNYYKDYTGDRDVFSSLESTLEADYAITENFSVRAYIDCGWAVDHEVRQAWKDDPKQNSFNVRYGAGCTYAF